MVNGFAYRHAMIPSEKYNYLYDVTTKVSCSPSYFADPPWIVPLNNKYLCSRAKGLLFSFL